MRKFLIPLMLSFIFIFSACQEPQTYYDDIETEYYKVINIKDSLDILLNENELDVEAVKGGFEDANKVCDEAIKKVENLGAFNDDDRMQKAALELFKQMKSLLDNEYKELFELYQKPFEDWSDQDISKMYDLFDSIENKFYEKDDKFYQAQLDFIEKHEEVKIH